MNSMIYNPNEEYSSKFKELHLKNTNDFLDSLVKQSAVNVEENRATVKLYKQYNENIKKLKKKYNLWRFLRVLMIISIILIPLVLVKITPKIKALRSEIKLSDSKADEQLELARKQMAPLNALFTERDALTIIESTLPLISFAPCFSAEQKSDMIVNYDFDESYDPEETTLDVLAGHYNENPFFFEKKLIHKMGVETYHGYKTIHWIETYHDSDGKTHTRTRSQTLHATVVKPKPFYHTKVLLNYGAQGGPELSFSRNASHLERKSEKEIEKIVKKGEKKLKKKTDEAIKQNRDFVSMSNSDFEVLFDALDRTDEVQYRTLFTPLAQTNMVDLILSKEGYGDDFDFIKKNRANRIVSEHSQGRPLCLRPENFVSYSFDEIKSNFINKNADFFKSVYFDLAPILAIPVYQERPVHSLKPIPKSYALYSEKEYETLANAINPCCVVHPNSNTPAILKSSFVRSQDGVDEISIKALSYDIVKRIDFIPVHGDDGDWHSVPVPWDDYIPLEAENNFFVTADASPTRSVLAKHNDLCIFN